MLGGQQIWKEKDTGVCSWNWASIQMLGTQVTDEDKRGQSLASTETPTFSLSCGVGLGKKNTPLDISTILDIWMGYHPHPPTHISG